MSSPPPNEPAAAAKPPPSTGDLQREVRRLLEYAVARSQVAISDELIELVTRLTRADSATMSDVDEANLWKCLNTLSSAVTPATLESVRIVRDLERDQRERPRFLRLRWKDAEGRKLITWARRWMLFALLAVIVLQVYTLVLSSIVSTVEASGRDLRITRAERAQIAQATSANDSASAMLDAADAKMRTAEHAFQAGYVMLLKWSMPWSWAFILRPEQILPGIETDAAARAAISQVSIQNAAGAVLRALALYVVPLFYGLLGASAYILRRLGRQLDDSTFSVVSLFKFRLRLALGALLGATVGLFTTSEGATLYGAGIGMVALAFLAGYSVEFAFSIFDALIEKGRKAVGVDASAPPAVGHGQTPPRTAAAVVPVAAARAGGN